MNRRLLLIICTDPRSSARPAEAIRIAAGLSVWEKTKVQLCFREAAVLSLSEDPGQFVDDENYTRYLPLIGTSRVPVYVEKGAALLPQLGQPALPYQEIADSELALLAAQSDFVARF
jgi:hypothetical protein